MRGNPDEDEQADERDDRSSRETDSEPTSSGHSTAETQTERNIEDESPS